MMTMIMVMTYEDDNDDDEDDDDDDEQEQEDKDDEALGLQRRLGAGGRPEPGSVRPQGLMGKDLGGGQGWTQGGRTSIGSGGLPS